MASKDCCKWRIQILYPTIFKPRKVNPEECRTFFYFVLNNWWNYMSELGIWNVVLWHRWSWWTIHLNFPFMCYLCPPFMSWICYKLLSFLFRQHIFCWRCLKPGMRCQIPWTRNGWVQCGRIVSDWVLQPTRYLK